jgi:hypothetical protein
MTGKRLFELETMTPDAVLAKMTPGVGYSAADITKRMHCSSEIARDRLLKLKSSGKAEVRMIDARHRVYYVAGSVPVKVKTGSEFEVAQPPLPIRLDTNLTGYDDEFKRRAALCMTVRHA